MSARYKLNQFSLPGAILFGLLVGFFLFARKRVGKNTSSSPVVKHPANTNPNDALKYWTEEKMNNARPAKMPHIDESERKKENPPDR